MRNSLLPVLTVAFATACASGPRPQDGSTGRSGDQTVTVQGRSVLGTVRVQSDDQTREAQLPIEMETAWARLPVLLEELGLPIGSIDARRRRVAHAGDRIRRIDGKRLSSFIDCGMGATAEQYADSYIVTLAYEVVLKPDPSGNGISVEMRVDASAKPRAVSGGALRCTTKGVLEPLVFERLSLR